MTIETDIYTYMTDCIRIPVHGKIPKHELYLFSKFTGEDDFWGGDIVHKLVGKGFVDWRREELHTLPGMYPWIRGATIPEDGGVYIEAWPFKVTSFVSKFPRIVLTALDELVDHISAKEFLTSILDSELQPAATDGVWIGENVVAELKGWQDAKNPTKLYITYTDGLPGAGSAA